MTSVLTNSIRFRTKFYDFISAILLKSCVFKFIEDSFLFLFIITQWKCDIIIHFFLLNNHFLFLYLWSCRCFLGNFVALDSAPADEQGLWRLFSKTFPFFDPVSIFQYPISLFLIIGGGVFSQHKFLSYIVCEKPFSILITWHMINEMQLKFHIMKR